MPLREPLGGSCEKCNIYKIIPYISAGIFKGCLKNLILKGIMMMIRRTRHTRTKQGFEAWLKNCEGFLHWLIRKYYFGPTEHEDVFQEVCITAWKAYMSYDASFGTKLIINVYFLVRKDLNILFKQFPAPVFGEFAFFYGNVPRILGAVEQKPSSFKVVAGFQFNPLSLRNHFPKNGRKTKVVILVRLHVVFPCGALNPATLKTLLKVSVVVRSQFQKVFQPFDILCCDLVSANAVSICDPLTHRNSSCQTSVV